MECFSLRKCKNIMNLPIDIWWRRSSGRSGSITRSIISCIHRKYWRIVIYGSNCIIVIDRIIVSGRVDRLHLIHHVWSHIWPAYSSVQAFIVLELVAVSKSRSFFLRTSASIKQKNDNDNKYNKKEYSGRKVDGHLVEHLKLEITATLLLVKLARANQREHRVTTLTQIHHSINILLFLFLSFWNIQDSSMFKCKQIKFKYIQVLPFLLLLSCNSLRVLSRIEHIHKSNSIDVYVRKNN